jgi:hypothetical protein
MNKEKIYSVNSLIPNLSVIVEPYFFEQFINDISSKYKIVIEHDSFDSLSGKIKYECDYYYAINCDCVAPSKIHVATISEVA